MVYRTVFMPYEVGDYSLFIREDLKDYAYILIEAEDHLMHISKEVLPSEAGTIIYFKEKIKDIFFEGMIYRAYCYIIQGYTKYVLEYYLSDGPVDEEKLNKVNKYLKVERIKANDL